MKTGIVSAVLALVMPVCVYATTLRLSTDIDLLVLDGKKVSSSLLRGQIVLSWIMVRTRLSFVSKKIFASPVMNNAFIFLPHW